jgi:hypothetical protein
VRRPATFARTWPLLGAESVPEMQRASDAVATATSRLALLAGGSVAFSPAQRPVSITNVTGIDVDYLVCSDRSVTLKTYGRVSWPFLKRASRNGLTVMTRQEMRSNGRFPSVMVV